uniref:HIT domain-containing protein n=1 Tax=Hyaloperonospora arabidopsidis (strain Emoy2) TaxID=559515 RepID=M4B9X8_HYAAE
MKRVRACVFCRKAIRERNQIVYEDAKVFVILDHYPRAKKHVLVIPHEHILSVNDVTPAHLDLLEYMLTTGKEILARDGFIDETDCRFGFHRFPFASVPHLHLHCLGLPFIPAWNSMRYTESMLSSYVSAESAIAALRTKQEAISSSSDSMEPRSTSK